MNPIARQRRFDRIRQIGCLACKKLGAFRVPEVHHMNLDGKAGQKRLGDAATVGLCPWHHQKNPGLSSIAYCEERLGPSLKDARRFRETFGSDEDLLAWQDELIAKAEAKVVGRVA